MSQLSNQIKIAVSAPAAAATTAVNSPSVDMAGYEGVLFMTRFGTAASNNTVNAAGSADDSTFTDYTGSSVVSGTSDEVVWIDVYRPIDRYVRLEAARGTSSTLESVTAILYGGRKQPISNVLSGTIIGEAHVSPTQGTA